MPSPQNDPPGLPDAVPGPEKADGSSAGGPGPQVPPVETAAAKAPAAQAPADVPAGGNPVVAPPVKPAAPASPQAGKPAAKPSPIPKPSAVKVQVAAVGAKAFKKNKFLTMAVLFAIVGAGMWGSMQIYGHFKGKKSAEKEKSSRGGSEAVAVNALEVKQEPFQDTLMAVGTIAGGAEVPLRFEVDGAIQTFDYREGDKVRRGEIIARLNQRDVFLKMKRAELELDQYEKLYAIGGVVRARLEEARLAVDLARSDMEKTIMRAPRDGILGDKDAEPGEFVTPNKKIATLVSIDSVIVRVGIIEKEIDKVFPGQKVVLTVDTYPGVEFSGKVENISPLVQGTSKTLTVEARLDNEGGLLLPGMFARTKIAVFEEPNTIVIPNDSVDKTPEGGYRVFVVTKDNKAEARNINVGYISSQFTQVVSGLSPGEMVITQKPQELKAGTPVKVIEVQK